MQGFAEECAQGTAFGCDGKTLIHPNQIGSCNQAFAPTAEALASARAIVAAFADPDNAGKGAIRVEGKMAERLPLAEAERLLALQSARSAERRVGKACGSTCRSRWSPEQEKKKTNQQNKK